MFKNVQDEFCKKHEGVGRELLRNLFNNTDKYRIYFADYIYDEVDFIMFGTAEVFAGDIKAYRGSKCIRKHNERYNVEKGKIDRKYNDYELDASKLQFIEDRAKRINGTPLLVVFFADCVMIWNLHKTNWRDTVYLKEGNKQGSNQEEKELTEKAKLYFKDAIYTNFDIHA